MLLTLALAAFLIAPSAEDSAEAYRSLLRAMDHGAFAEAQVLAEGVDPAGPFGRKAAGIARLAGRLAGDRHGSPELPPGAAQLQVGALRLALTPDGAFSGAVLPEVGVGGYRPILFGWPDAFSSRLSLMVDGEAIMLAPLSSPRARGDALELATRERDVSVRLRVSGRCLGAAHDSPESQAELAISATVTNQGQPREIGVRLLLDLAEGFDDAPDVRLGSENVLLGTRELVGDALPRALHVGTRAVVLRAPGRLPPDRVLLTPLAPALDAPFDFAFEPGIPLGPDSAIAVYVDPLRLGKGESHQLEVDLVARSPEGDRGGPVATDALVEPVRSDPHARRIVLALENAARGATGPAEDLRIEVRPSPGLTLVESPGDLRRLGTLPEDEIAQRSFVVRPDFTRADGLEVSFDVSSRRAGGDRASRTVRVPVSPPSSPAIAGRIVDERGRGVPGAEVELLREGRPVGKTRSDGGGRYRFRSVPPLMHEIRASAVVHREPAAKADRAVVDDLLYDVVLTSETIGNDGGPRRASVLPGEGRDVVLKGSLTRYSILVSVQWDAPRDYLEQIASGMRRAAEFLYVASDGQLTFGRVAIVDAGESWNHADLYDWANNSVHPNASVAGIRHRYDPVHAPWNTAMNFGRQWAGHWYDHGLYSTVVHEFGHYGLGLYDEYLGAPDGRHRGLQYREMCRCIMGYQYSDHKICWDGNHHGYTNQGLWNRRSCWRQIEDTHEGIRSGFFAPIATPRERGGVVPPEFESRIGEEMKVVIRDQETGGFDAPLRLAGPFGTALGGVDVYTEIVSEGRTLYQGRTRGNGTMELMGVHPGDRVWGLYQGARGETWIDRRREAYVLELGGEPGSELGPPPLVLVRPEQAAGVPAGLAVEIVPLEPPDGPPSLVLMRADRQPVELTVVEDGDRRSFVGLVPQEALDAGRVTLECVLPDAIDGDAVVVTDVVTGELAPDADSELAAFDGSIRVRVPSGAIGEPLSFAIASTTGPALQEEELRSVGRFHAILPGAELEVFAAPATLLFAPIEGVPSERLVPRRYDAEAGGFVELAVDRILPGGELLTTLESPGVVGLFER